MNTETFASKLVLVVEDEPNLSEVLEAYLRCEGFRTERAGDGESALRLFHAAKPDLVLLDVMMPKLDGFEVLRRVRQAGNTPVIMVTARVEDIDRLVGLRMGADDYVVKPFNPPEVVERVKAVLRRSRSEDQEKPIRVAGLELDPRGMQVTVSGTRLELTLSEYRLLELFVRHPGRVFSRSELLELCLPESEALERVVDAHIGSVRRKLGAVGLANPLESVRGVGYRLVGRTDSGATP